MCDLSCCWLYGPPMYAAAMTQGVYIDFEVQMGFQDFLQKCEILEFDFDPKAIQQGRMTPRHMEKFKVGKEPPWPMTPFVSAAVTVFVTNVGALSPRQPEICCMSRQPCTCRASKMSQGVWRYIQMICVFVLCRATSTALGLSPSWM